MMTEFSFKKDNVVYVLHKLKKAWAIEEFCILMVSPYSMGYHLFDSTDL